MQDVKDQFKLKQIESIEKMTNGSVSKIEKSFRKQRVSENF